MKSLHIGPWQLARKSSKRAASWYCTGHAFAHALACSVCHCSDCFAIAHLHLQGAVSAGQHQQDQHVRSSCSQPCCSMIHFICEAECRASSYGACCSTVHRPGLPRLWLTRQPAWSLTAMVCRACGRAYCPPSSWSPILLSTMCCMSGCWHAWQTSGAGSVQVRHASTKTFCLKIIILTSILA